MDGPAGAGVVVTAGAGGVGNPGMSKKSSGFNLMLGGAIPLEPIGRIHIWEAPELRI